MPLVGRPGPGGWGLRRRVWARLFSVGGRGVSPALISWVCLRGPKLRLLETFSGQVLQPCPTSCETQLRASRFWHRFGAGATEEARGKVIPGGRFTASLSRARQPGQGAGGPSPKHFRRAPESRAPCKGQAGLGGSDPGRVRIPGGALAPAVPVAVGCQGCPEGGLHAARGRWRAWRAGQKGVRVREGGAREREKLARGRRVRERQREERAGDRGGPQGGRASRAEGGRGERGGAPGAEKGAREGGGLRGAARGRGSGTWE